MTVMTLPTGRNFFVLGLPRSRTAWLANFLTCDGHFCFHEGIDGCRSIDDYEKKLGHHGDSGTAMMMFDMNTLFPDSPKVIIESDPRVAIEYARNVFGLDNPTAIYYAKERLDAIDGLRINRDDINERLPEIWSHLIGEGYNEDRAKMLIKFNVQVMNPCDIDYDATRELFYGNSFS